MDLGTCGISFGECSLIHKDADLAGKRWGWQTPSQPARDLTGVPGSPFPDAQILPVQPEGTEAISPHIPDRTVAGEARENSAPKLLTFFYFHKSPYNRSVGG